MGYVVLVVIIWTTTPVAYLLVKSLRFIWNSTQTSDDLERIIYMTGPQDSKPRNGRRVKCPFTSLRWFMLYTYLRC